MNVTAHASGSGSKPERSLRSSASRTGCAGKAALDVVDAQILIIGQMFSVTKSVTKMLALDVFAAQILIIGQIFSVTKSVTKMLALKLFGA